MTLGVGLQGKLVLCFTFLLAVALAASCWQFISESREILSRTAAEQVNQLSRTLAMASEPPLARRDTAELQQIGAELMKNKGIVAIAFFDAAGNRLAIAAHDADLERPESDYFPNPRESSDLLGKPVTGWTRSLGGYVQMTSTVRHAATIGAGTAAPGQTVGYVTVCVSQGETESRVRNVTLSVILIGAVAVLVSLPMMYLLVHRIFEPIRELVVATHRIAAGDLDAEVAVDRRDVIGTLARSFNDMVQRVRAQQHDLALANDRLAESNEQLAETNEQLAESNRQLEGSNQNLEEKVRVRTAELERANQRLSSEIAEKDDFLRTVSHDLNAPLRNIAGMATMLLMKHRDTFNEDVVHRLERILKNVEVETDLIAELLELSRIKSRRQKMEVVQLDQLLHDVAGLFAVDFESRQISLSLDTAMPLLVCERARFRQVFQNLIDNAIKYMGEGSTVEALRLAGHPVDANATGGLKEIRVGCHVSPDAVEFYVRDTGLGIDASEIDNVFRVFRRGKSQAVQAIAGKGVGLSSVKSIVENYGGSIRVESQVGAGSTFRFTVDGKYLQTNASHWRSATGEAA